MSVNCYKLFILNTDSQKDPNLQTDPNLKHLKKLVETKCFVKLDEIRDERIIDGQIIPNKEVFSIVKYAV